MEDEIHVTLECPRYLELRKHYIPLEYRQNPNTEEAMISLLTARTTCTVNNLAMFAKKAFALHQKYTNDYTEGLIGGATL